MKHISPSSTRVTSKALNPPSSRLQKILNLVGLSLVAYALLRFTVGDRLGIVACCSNCVPIILLPAILVVPIALKLQDRFMLTWSLCGALYLLVMFSPLMLAREVPPTDCEPLRILSFNTGQALPTWEDTNRLIQENDADIILYQEITKEFIDQFWPQLVYTYPYQVHGPLQGDRQAGMGILSRYPITETKDFKLANDGLVFQQKAVANIEGRLVSVYNIHLTYPWIRIRQAPIITTLPWPYYDDQVRHQEVDELIKLLEAELNPVVAAGDFNLTDQSTDYRRITRLLRDSYRSVATGLGLTWPANFVPVINLDRAVPLVRVDYIFHSPSIHPVSAQVLRSKVSDHRPVAAKLILTE